MIQEKKIGLFKKKIYGISLDNHLNIANTKLCLNNLYNKKIGSTIFKSYISNNNKNLNDSYGMNNNYFQINGLNNISSSILSYESKNCDNIKVKKHYNSYYNLNNHISNSINYNDLIKNDNQNQDNQIKLEQIITFLSFEDLLIIEDKLNIVLNILKNGKKTKDELFDLWNYFFSSSLEPKFEQIYKYYLKETEAVKTFINYSLILLIICYDFSFNSNNSNNNLYFSLYEALRLVYINLLIVIYSIKNKIQSENKDHYNLRLIEMSNINKIIGKNLINFNNSYNEDDNSFNRELLHNNANLLIKNISLIIKNYKHQTISNLFDTIKTNTLEEINIFFRKNILQEDYLGCSVLASTYLKEKQIFTLGESPYISTKSNKKYSLVLDLDETLIHFKVNNQKNNEGVLKLRPGVVTFLEEVHEYYELILFTEASEAYTELILEAFDNKKKYFDYKLYRQHTIIIGQDFVKDIQKIGRPLDKIIIIDNIAQNFRMQKANGINIKPFFGEDKNDQALIDLIPILINIAKENIDTRNGLIKYRDEIITKITSNLYGRNL